MGVASIRKIATKMVDGMFLSLLLLCPVIGACIYWVFS